MKDIILEAMERCALNYAKGYPRWKHLWDEKLTIEQKAEQIAQYLDDNGYLLIKHEDLRPLVDDNGE